MDRRMIFEAINTERIYQGKKWGDKPHTVGNFLLIMEGELEEAKQGWRKGIGDADALREILQVIAVGVACLEQHGIVERGEQQQTEIELLKIEVDCLEQQNDNLRESLGWNKR